MNTAAAAAATPATQASHPKGGVQRFSLKSGNKKTCNTCFGLIDRIDQVNNRSARRPDTPCHSFPYLAVALEAPEIGLLRGLIHRMYMEVPPGGYISTAL